MRLPLPASRRRVRSVRISRPPGVRRCPGRGDPRLKRLAQEHEVVALLLQDPAEEHMRGSGFFRAREAETGREFVTHGRSRWLETEAAERELVRYGIDRLRIRTDRPFEHALRNLFRARGFLGRGSR